MEREMFTLSSKDSSATWHFLDQKSLFLSLQMLMVKMFLLNFQGWGPELLGHSCEILHGRCNPVLILPGEAERFVEKSRRWWRSYGRL